MKLNLMKQPKMVAVIFAALVILALSYAALKEKKAAIPAEVPAIAAPAVEAK